MKMTLRPFLLSVVLLALAANPCFAKDGHAQHGARASASGASGKGASGANPAPSKASVPIDAESPVAPPVLPPHGVRQQQIRTINPSGKIPANTVNRATMGSRTTPVVPNAIGQSVVSPRNFSAQPPGLAPQRPGMASPPIIHGGPAAPSASLGAARANVATAANRGTVNGATMIRPAAGPSVVGGPAQTRYGINGTTVQNKH